MYFSRYYVDVNSLLQPGIYSVHILKYIFRYSDLKCSLYFVQIWILWWYCMLMLLLKKIKRYLMINALSCNVLLLKVTKYTPRAVLACPMQRLARTHWISAVLTASTRHQRYSSCTFSRMLPLLLLIYQVSLSKIVFYFSFKYIPKIWDFRFQSVNTCTLM